MSKQTGSGLIRQARASDTLIFLMMRRMRAPLIALIASFSISILGFVLIPGIDDQGNTWHMDFFHAFYFTSFMATTIGFGEIPYEFTDLQRSWAIVSIFMTVIAWLYAFGTIISLLQDRAVQHALTESTFNRQVRNSAEPFYIVCGYGDCGHMLLHSLTHRGYRAVVVELDDQRIDELTMEHMPVHVPALAGDAGNVATLSRAGLKHPKCVGVAAMTGSDHVNLKIAITVKLLNPRLQVVGRSETTEAAANMDSFGTDYIVTPFENFASLLTMAIRSPAKSQLYDWLYGIPSHPLAEQILPPDGRWIICGFGRMGQALYKYFMGAHIPTTIIDIHPEHGPEGTIAGKGTEAVTLEEANIYGAVGIIAATDDDADNLSIIMTARDMKPDLFLATRQNSYVNSELFEAANVDYVMHPSTMISRETMADFTAPLLSRFMRLAAKLESREVESLLERIAGFARGETPVSWVLEFTAEHAPAAVSWLEKHHSLELAQLMCDFRHPDTSLPLMAMMVVRDQQETLLPDDGFMLRRGDRILFCGCKGVRHRMRYVLSDAQVMQAAMETFLEQRQMA